MAARIEAWVIENGLSGLKSSATHIEACSADPASYAAATTTNNLGTKNFGAGSVFPGAIANGAVTGRKVTSAAVTDGTISTAGTITHLAVTDRTNSRLLAVIALASGVTVTTSGFTATAFDITIPAQ